MIKPLRDYVLISEIKPSETLSKIIINEVDSEINYLGQIVDAGNSADVKVGDRVVFKRHLFDEIIDPVFTPTGLDITNSKTRYFLGKQENITALVQ